MNPTNFIINQTYAKDSYNILTAVSHERYEPNLALTGHHFYSFIRKEETRTWNKAYAPIPHNYSIFNYDNMPPYIDYDLMISHNPFVHIPLMKRLCCGAHVPLINVLHTMPVPGWDDDTFKQIHQMFDMCDYHIAITMFNAIAWKVQKNLKVIHHGIDSDFFVPSSNKIPIVMTVANDFINRDWALGFRLWKSIIEQNIPYRVVGNTPGLSKGANNINELLGCHQNALIYLNTSLYSPIPMSVLEAMSCGCCVVSTNTCALPDIIEHEKDGFLFSPNKPQDFVKCINHLLKNQNEAIEIGKRARAKIQDMFSIDRFIKEWNEVICHLMK